VGAAALLANLICFALLYQHRSDSLNMSSTWLCSRNDLVANVGVLFAAAASYFFASRWPDILVGVTIAGLFLTSAVSVLRDAIRALRAPPARQPVSRPVRVTIHTRTR
jgi:Co/Zn/Cd efflux system component